MKFLKKNFFLYSDNINDNKKFDNLEYIFDLENCFFYEKSIKKKKNYLNKIRPGICENKKKSSILRDENFSFINQYININLKNGKKNSFFKSLNTMNNNLFFCFKEVLPDFEKYKNYHNIVFLYNLNNDYSDLNNIITNYIKDLKSIFEIRTIKNNKKLNLPNKYSHEIIYLPKERRAKYVLKALSLYKENFKKYDLWERIFWSFFLTILNKNNSAIAKRKTYIYIKSLKFFKKKIKKSN